MSEARTARDAHRSHLTSVYFSRSPGGSAHCPALVLLRDTTVAGGLVDRILAQSRARGGTLLRARAAFEGRFELDDGSTWTGKLAPAVERVLGRSDCSTLVAETGAPVMAGDASIWAFDAAPASVEAVYRDLKRLAARGETRLPTLYATFDDPGWLRRLARDLEGAVRRFLGYKVTVWTDEEALAMRIVSLAERVSKRKSPSDRRRRVVTLLEACSAGNDARGAS